MPRFSPWKDWQGFHRVLELHSSDICQYFWPVGSEVVSTNHTDTQRASSGKLNLQVETGKKSLAGNWDCKKGQVLLRECEMIALVFLSLSNVCMVVAGILWQGLLAWDRTEKADLGMCPAIQA